MHDARAREERLQVLDPLPTHLRPRREVRVLRRELAARVQRGKLQKLLEAPDLRRTRSRIGLILPGVGQPGDHGLLHAEAVLEQTLRLGHVVGSWTVPVAVAAHRVARLVVRSPKVLEHAEVLAGERDAGQSVEPLEERCAPGAATGAQDEEVLLLAQVTALVLVVGGAAAHPLPPLAEEVRARTRIHTVAVAPACVARLPPLALLPGTYEQQRA